MLGDNSHKRERRRPRGLAPAHVNCPSWSQAATRVSRLKRAKRRLNSLINFITWMERLRGLTSRPQSSRSGLKRVPA